MASEFGYTVSYIREIEWDYVTVLLEYLRRKYSNKTSSSELKGYDSAAIKNVKRVSTA
jgi:hypothetical protein